MLINIEIKKSSSIWLICIFTSILLIATIIIEFFQAPINANKELDYYRKLLAKENIKDIKGIIIKNRLGIFNIKKEDNNWKLIYPRKFPARKNSIEKLIKSLGNITIKRIYRKDSINISNFALDNPTAEITLLKENQEDINIKLGLINPIDGSTYASVSQRDVIYHIDIIKTPLDSLDIPNIIDSRIFFIKEGQPNIFKISKNKKTILSIKKHTSEEWINNRGEKLIIKNVENLINKIKGIKSLFILDKTSEKLNKELKTYIENPLYNLTVVGKNKQEIIYTISNPIGSLTGIKMQKWKNVLITASNRPHPYIASKEIIRILNKKYNLKKLSFKKLFY